MTKLITESDLILPSLKALSENEEEGLTTEDLQEILREALKPEGQDLLLLKGRNDDRFSQKVRNLKSHNRLERDGLAIYEDGTYRITELGRSFVEAFDGVDVSFSDQGFSEHAKNAAMVPTKPLVFVEEGQITRVSSSVRRRSRRLRQYAFAYYSDDEGHIRCHGCDFEGSEVYGDLAKGLIEMHHTKPISISESAVKPLSEAVKDIIPLCPTCHRLVHRDPNTLMSMDELRKLLAAP